MHHVLALLILLAGCSSTPTPTPAPSASVLLEGTASDDGEPFGTLTTTWRLIDGPAPVTIHNPNALTTPALFTQPGRYTLELIADDGALQTTDDVLVTIEPKGTP